jgi:hypothetical protein
MAAEDDYTPDELSVGGAPIAPTVTGVEEPAAPAPSAAALESTPGRPNEPEGWAQGATGSAAEGAPAPGTVGG